MKAKYVLPAVVILLAAGGWWFGRAAWRAHRGLVRLDVREMPMAEVLRKIEWQTWKKIRAEKSVANARVTLHVTDKPLSYVLNRLASQAGARWSTVYAVYDSSRALNALDAVLRDDGKFESAGWTKLAPMLPDSDKLPVPPSPGPGEAGPHVMSGAEPGTPPPDGSGPGPGPRGMIFARRGPNGPAIFFHGRPNGPVEMWSPEELVIESSLRPRLGEGAEKADVAATAVAAGETARRVNAHWTTYLAFRKSSMGVGFGGMPPAPPAPGHVPQPPNPNKRFSDLTPAQRVEQARERRGLSKP